MNKHFKTLKVLNDELRFLCEVKFGDELETCRIIILMDEVNWFFHLDDRDDVIVRRKEENPECPCPSCGFRYHGETVAKGQIKNLRLDLEDWTHG